MKGWVYIMSNSSFSDGRIKIGMSANDPIGRKLELESSGVPEPFVIEYKVVVDDFKRIEREVHVLLDEYRPNKKREFFTCSIPDAIFTIRSVSNIAFEENNYMSPQEIQEKELRRKRDIETQAKKVALKIKNDKLELEKNNRKQAFEQIAARPEVIKKKFLWTWGIGLALAPITSGISLFGSYCFTPTLSDLNTAKDEAQKASIKIRKYETVQIAPTRKFYEDKQARHRKGSERHSDYVAGTSKRTSMRPGVSPDKPIDIGSNTNLKRGQGYYGPKEQKEWENNYIANKTKTVVDNQFTPELSKDKVIKSEKNTTPPNHETISQPIKNEEYSNQDWQDLKAALSTLKKPLKTPLKQLTNKPLKTPLKQLTNKSLGEKNTHTFDNRTIIREQVQKTDSSFEKASKKEIEASKHLYLKAMKKSTIKNRRKTYQESFLIQQDLGKYKK